MAKVCVFSVAIDLLNKAQGIDKAKSSMAVACGGHPGGDDRRPPFNSMSLPPNDFNKVLQNRIVIYVTITVEIAVTVP